VSETDEIFRTFCHISEYGADGYANLHRLVATSSPLVLWAPSSQLLASSDCLLSESDFIKLIEERKIRIIGREKWLTSKDFRNSYKWPGAWWNSKVDGAILSMVQSDATLKLSERRVAVAEDERGETWAREFLAANPDAIAKIHGALTANDANRQFPQGVVETARRLASKPEVLAHSIVRDAYNHEDAIQVAGTQSPFLLAERESVFHGLLESIRSSRPAGLSAPTPAMPSPSLLADLTDEVLMVLRALDKGRRTKLTKFVYSDGHRMLSEWMGSICATLACSGATDVRGQIYQKLQREFDNGSLEDSWSDIFLTSTSVVGSAGTAAGVVESITSELTVLGSIGLASGGYSIGYGLAQKAGYASVKFSGPEWPFIYAFGRKASGKRYKKLGAALDSLRPSDD